MDEITFDATQPGERLDKAVAAQLEDYSRVQIQGFIRDGLVTVNDNPVKASYRLEAGDTVCIRLPAEEGEQVPQPEEIPLVVLYEDEHIAVIDKPAGMVIHPSYGHTSGTLVNAVLARWPQTAAFSEEGRAGIVHRLDKETSGVVAIAKTQTALDSLREQFKARTITKRYIALVEGAPETHEGVIDAPIGRDPNQRKRMAVVRDGRESVTEFRAVDYFANYTLLDVFPKTGRTHQIRVHLAFIGLPVVGDAVYGRRKQGIRLKRHFLHAATLTLQSPGAAEPVVVEAPLPVGLQNTLEKLPR